MVYPFASDRDEVFLTLSGIIFVGNTVDQRYVLHQHLVNLDLAGPRAHCAVGRVYPRGWAFEEAPVVSLSEWEECRRGSTSTVILI